MPSLNSLEGKTPAQGGNGLEPGLKRTGEESWADQWRDIRDLARADKTQVRPGTPGYEKVAGAVQARAKFGPARDSFLRALDRGHVYTFEGTGGARAITFGANVYVPTSSLALNDSDLGLYLLHEDFHLIDYQQTGLIGQILRPESYADTFAVSATLRGTANNFATEVDLYRGVLNGYNP